MEVVAGLQKQIVVGVLWEKWVEEAVVLVSLNVKKGSE